MILTTYLFAGEHERFAPDVRLPESGQVLQVSLPDGSRCSGSLVSAERVDNDRIRVSVEVASDSAPYIQGDVSHFSL